jgi:hypothetical protein
MGIPDGDLSPRGTGMGKKCPPQAFVGIPAGKFFRRGDGFGELKPDGEFPVAISTRNIQAGQQSRRDLRQRLEHQTATSLLPLRCFQVVHIPRTHAKFGHQGRVGLASAKPDPPSGAKRGDPLCVEIFLKKRSLLAEYLSCFLTTSKSGS